MMTNERLAEKMVNRCDGIVTMDSDQRRACKAWILECLDSRFPPADVKELPDSEG